MLKQVFLKAQIVKGELVLTPLNYQGLVNDCKVKTTKQLTLGKYYQADLVLVNKEFIVDEKTLSELSSAPLKGFVYGKTDKLQKALKENKVILGRNNDNYLVQL